MRLALALLSVSLAGCPAAILLGMATSDSKGSDGQLHPPRAQDYDAWVGATKAQLETHRQFSVVPREVRHVSDGSELWILRVCGPKQKSDECCLHQFVFTGSNVSQYRTLGPCGVDCNARPEPKIAACFKAEGPLSDGNGHFYSVPDGYR